MGEVMSEKKTWKKPVAYEISSDPKYYEVNPTTDYEREIVGEPEE